jgi:hypothetical protein
MTTQHEQSDNLPDVPGALSIDCERLTPTKTRVKAWLKDKLIFCDVFDVNSANGRARFAKGIAKIAKASHKVEVDVEAVADELLLRFNEAEMLAGDEDVNDDGQAEYRLDYTADEPERHGLYRDGPDGPAQLCNFGLVIDEDITVQDDVASRRMFLGRVELLGTTSEMRIAAEDFANNAKLPEAVFRAAGARARILCKPQALRTAVSAVSVPKRRTTTTNFGWTPDLDAFLAQSGWVDAQGFHPYGDIDGEVRVDLKAEQCARWLDLAGLEAGALAEVKHSVVQDFLPLDHRAVTYSLLATAALAPLQRFAVGMNRYGLWLTGLTGDGKSFVAKLTQNFFGDYPLNREGSHFATWSSTSNFVQRQGYFFRDALFLVDDYKPELVRYQAEIVRVLQAYADGSARGRLNADATTNISREIRGILVATGEDVPEHSASSLARLVVIPVPRKAKDIERGNRCLAQRPFYRGLMADFIRHLIAHGRPQAFADRVQQLQSYYYAPIAGRPNDIRIAGNLALLGAAFEEFAGYLGAAWPAGAERARDFVEAELVVIRDATLSEVRDQQASEVFLAALGALICNGQVQVVGYYPGYQIAKGLEHKPVIGREVTKAASFEIATKMAIAAVQDFLARQRRPALAVTEKTLIMQLAGDGKLLDKDNKPIDPKAGGDRTWSAKLAGETRHVFRISAHELVGADTADTQKQPTTPDNSTA